MEFLCFALFQTKQSYLFRPLYRELIVCFMDYPKLQMNLFLSEKLGTYLEKKHGCVTKLKYPTATLRNKHSPASPVTYLCESSFFLFTHFLLEDIIMMPNV